MKKKKALTDDEILHRLRVTEGMLKSSYQPSHDQDLKPVEDFVATLALMPQLTTLLGREILRSLGGNKQLQESFEVRFGDSVRSLTSELLPKLRLAIKEIGVAFITDREIRKMINNAQKNLAKGTSSYSSTRAYLKSRFVEHFNVAAHKGSIKVAAAAAYEASGLKAEYEEYVTARRAGRPYPRKSDVVSPTGSYHWGMLAVKGKLL